MPLGVICRYFSRAIVFALVVSIVYSLIRLARLRFRILHPRREAAILFFVFYTAALIEIIALRGKFHWNPGGWGHAVQWRLLYTTLGELFAGTWRFIYHFCGNALWFLPLGFLLPTLWSRPFNLWQTILTGFSLSVLLETMQYLLATGATDIDDVLLNTMGTALGYAIFALRKHQIARKAKSLL